MLAHVLPQLLACSTDGPQLFDSVNATNTATCLVALNLHSKRMQTLPIIFFIFSKFQRVVITGLDVIH